MTAAQAKNPSGAATVIGWREYVALPDWGIDALRAKIDTGARTSALHVVHCMERSAGLVTFDVVLSRQHPERTVRVEAGVVRTSRVRSSNGQVQSRPVVAARIRLGGLLKTIEVGLVERPHMLCRMLLGRSALGTDFVVDPVRKYLLGRRSDARPGTERP